MSAAPRTNGPLVALASELEDALSLVPEAERLKAVGDVGLLSWAVTRLRRETVDDATQNRIGRAFAEISTTVYAMRQCARVEEKTLVFVDLRKLVIGLDVEIDWLLVLIAGQGGPPVDRLTVILELQSTERTRTWHLKSDAERMMSHIAIEPPDARVSGDMFAAPNRHADPSAGAAKVLEPEPGPPGGRGLEEQGSYERRKADQFRRYFIASQMILMVVALSTQAMVLFYALSISLTAYLAGQARHHRNNHRIDTVVANLPEEKLKIFGRALKKWPLAEPDVLRSVLAAVARAYRRR
jgi:hypothetical protein